MENKRLMGIRAAAALLCTAFLLTGKTFAAEAAPQTALAQEAAAAQAAQETGTETAQEESARGSTEAALDGEARPRLIQTTAPEEECDNLIALDILQVMPVQSGSLAEAEQRNLPAVVRVEVGDYVGSGVIFEITGENIIVISNKHLLECADSGRVTFRHGQTVTGSEIRLSKQYDLGLICVPREALDNDSLIKLRRVSRNNECSMRAQSGDSLFVIGSRNGPGADIYEGELIDAWWYSEEFGTHMLYNGCSAQHGISGGGTFDAHGHYLGMLSAGNGSETLSLPLVTILQEYALLAGELSCFGG